MENFKTSCNELGLTDAQVRNYATANNIHAGAIIGYFTGDYLENATQAQVNAVANHFYNVAVNSKQFTGTADQFYNNTNTFDFIVNLLNK